MIQRRDRTGLAVESLAALRIGGSILRQNLDRYGAIKPGVAGTVYFAHAAGSQQGLDFIGPEFRSCTQHHRCEL
jgi:hypothetical protein